MSVTCGCGCGQPTPIAKRSDAAKGWVKGQPLEWIRGHRHRSSPLEYLPDETTGCWIWQRAIRADGYGQAYVDNRPRLAHRAFYERLVGPIPDGLQLDHLCRTRACVNPAHLEPVTNAENSRRGARAKLTHELAEVIRQSPLPAAEIAGRLGVSTTTVGAVRTGVAWS